MTAHSSARTRQGEWQTICKPGRPAGVTGQSGEWVRGTPPRLLRTRQRQVGNIKPEGRLGGRIVFDAPVLM
jgi:hypothetical protein